jgi:hypothetical protein
MFPHEVVYSLPCHSKGLLCLIIGYGKLSIAVGKPYRIVLPFILRTLEDILDLPRPQAL